MGRRRGRKPEEGNLKRRLGRRRSRETSRFNPPGLKHFYNTAGSIVKSHKPVEIPFAKLRFDPKNSEWTLFFLKGKGQWEQYPSLLHLCNLEAAVGEIKDDPLYLFSD